MKYAFYVSNKATRVIKCLEYLACTYPDLVKEIEFVLIDNECNSQLRTACSKHRIRLVERDLSGIEKSQRGARISDEINSLMQTSNVDYLFLFCDKVLYGTVLHEYKNRIINFHPSLLPAYQGLNAVDQALNAGAILLGNSAHIVVEEVDRGPIIMQSVLPRSRFRCYDDVLDLQVPMLAQILIWLRQSRIAVEGNQVHISNAKYGYGPFFPKLDIDYRDYLDASSSDKRLDTC